MKRQHDSTVPRFASHIRYACDKRCLIACLALGLITSAFATAQEPTAQPASVDAKLIEPFVGETTCLILKVEPNRIELTKVMEALEITPEAKAAIAEASQAVNDALVQLRMLADDQPVFATVGIPMSKQRVPVYLFRHKTSDTGAQKLVETVNGLPYFNAQVRDQYIVAVPKGVSDAMPAGAPRATLDAIDAALETVASYPAYAILVPPEHVWRTVRELSPELPRQLGGGPSHVLTDGLQWLAIGFDPKNVRIEVVIQSTNDQAAQDFAAHLPIMLRSAYAAATPIHQQIPKEMSDLLIDRLRPQVDGSRVKIRIDGLETTSTQTRQPHE